MKAESIDVAKNQALLNLNEYIKKKIMKIYSTL